MKDEVVLHAADRTLPADACTSKILPGVSIGISHTSTGSSTLGGFIEVLMPGESTWQKFALTCFHAVFPPEGDITHSGGLPGKKKRRSVKLQYDLSYFSHMFTVIISSQL